MTIGLYLLRAFQMGLRMDDLETLHYSDVMDMMIELKNDTCEYNTLATQDDFDRWR